MVNRKNQNGHNFSTPIKQVDSKSFGRVTRTALFTTALLTGCGWGSGGGAPGNTPVTTPTPPVDLPISGKGMIELGPVAGASVEIRTPAGVFITNATTAQDGTFSYSIPGNMRHQLDQNEVLVAISRNGTDTDPKDTGSPSSATPIAVKGVVQGFVPTSLIKAGQSFRINPMTAYIAESIIKSGGVVTVQRLDQHARELGTTDINSDGIADYRDILDHKMAVDSSPAEDAAQPFLATLHSWDTLDQAKIMEMAKFRENLVELSLVPGSLWQPSVQLMKSSWASKIIYTINGSVPEIGSSWDYTGGASIPAQNAELNYREVFLVNGKEEMGEVATFHLQHDAVAWSLEHNSIRSDISVTPKILQGTYENGSYAVHIQYDTMQEKRTYPAQMWVEISPNADSVGSSRYSARVLVYSDAYEQKLRDAFIAAAQEEIKTQAYKKKTDAVMPKYTQNQMISEASVAYRGYNYVAQSIYNLDGKSDFPVQIYAEYALPDSTAKQRTSTLTANNEADRVKFLKQVSDEAKGLIDTKITSTPTHSQNFQEIVYPQTTYKWGWVQVTYQWNLDGKSDFPVKVIGSYSLPLGGRQTNKEFSAKNTSELASFQSNLIRDMQSVIDVEVNAQPKSRYKQNERIETSTDMHRGGSYKLVTIMNLNGNADFPAKVSGVYRLPWGAEQDTMAFQANNATELTKIQNERIAHMKAEIDKSIDDKYPAGHTVVLHSSVSYNSGAYTIKFQYSTNSGTDYPGMVTAEYRAPNGTTESGWSMAADNENDRNTHATNAMNWAKGKIDANQNTPPKYAANTTVSTGSIAYRVGDYEVFAKYNRMGTNKDYPALVYGQYHTSPGSALKDTPRYEVQNEAEKESKKAEIITFIQSQIPVHKPNDEVATQYVYRWGDYSIKVKYNRVGTDQDFPALLWLEYHLPNNSKLFTQDPITITSESDLQTKIKTIQDAMKKLIDSKYAFNSTFDSMKWQLANLAKSIQFFPSAHAAPGSSEVPPNWQNKSVAPNYSKDQCGKYVVDVVKSVNGKANDVVLNSKYDLEKGLTLRSTFYFDSGNFSGNSCMIENKMDTLITQMTNKHYVGRNQVYITQGTYNGIQADIAFLLNGSVNPTIRPDILARLKQSWASNGAIQSLADLSYKIWKKTSEWTDQDWKSALVMDMVFDTVASGWASLALSGAKILVSTTGEVLSVVGYGPAFRNMMIGWKTAMQNSLVAVRNPAWFIRLELMDRTTVSGVKNGMLFAKNKQGIEYAFKYGKTLEHWEGGNLVSGKSFFYKSLLRTEDDVFNMEMKAMEKVTQKQIDKYLASRGAEADRIIVEMGEKIGYDAFSNTANVTRMEIKIAKSALESGKYLIHAYPVK